MTAPTAPRCKGHRLHHPSHPDSAGSPPALVDTWWSRRLPAWKLLLLSATLSFWGRFLCVTVECELGWGRRLLVGVAGFELSKDNTGSCEFLAGRGFEPSGTVGSWPLAHNAMGRGAPQNHHRHQLLATVTACCFSHCAGFVETDRATFAAPTPCCRVPGKLVQSPSVGMTQCPRAVPRQTGLPSRSITGL